ncbi:phage portal protein [Tomitella fengzijianii]|uniref:Phage portal protein n=1 Tax=Tomitella fengzijianii TaxID=2597660 RepID=A0A516X8C7_9ACTN|nr:phage portal protein [Tomitella fengzijianii]
MVEVVLEGIRGQSVANLWRDQPHLRTVVGYLARNIAQIGLHVYARDDDDGRTRLRTDPLAELLRIPNADQTGYELLYTLVADLALYDTAYWAVARDESRGDGRWSIRPIPPTWVANTYGNTAFGYGGYEVIFPESDGRPIRVPAKDMLVFHGWTPADPRRGTSPVQALKSTLAEQINAQLYRDQRWRKGARADAYIARPKDAPEWSKEARNRFVRAWRDAYTGNDGSDAGGNPLLEDGMELKRTGFSAKDDQYVETSRLSLETVAQVYHVNPTMVGLLDNANYSNVREFRRMLYGDTLGPTLEQIAQRINAFLAPRVAADPTAYVEFNVKAKLQGSFEEQAAVMQSAVGAPWMTVNEARARENMPAVESGDELVQPLNITKPGATEPIEAAD